jgi:LPXTG-motif cell wall-anchored protein
MGFRIGFYSLILAVAILSGIGFAVIDQASKNGNVDQTVVAAPLFGGDNAEEIIVQQVTATPTNTPVPPPPTATPTPAPAAAPAVAPAPPPPPAPAPPPAAKPAEKPAPAPAQAPRQLPRTGDGDFALYGLIAVGALLALTVVGVVLRRRRSA